MWLRKKTKSHLKKIFKKGRGAGYFIWYPEITCLIFPWSQSGLDCVMLEGGSTRCSSILLDWERRMRLKKSSSGTVCPLVVEGGAAHLWSLSLEP